jgi:hypothetical protein
MSRSSHDGNFAQADASTSLSYRRMNDELIPPLSSAPDWEAFLRRHTAATMPELDLSAIRPGDRLLVLTDHTAYTLTMREQRMADLTTNRADRPAGRVQVRGCTFGASSTIKPDHLFCGGNLEFSHGDKREVYTTTTIRALQLVHADQPGG